MTSPNPPDRFTPAQEHRFALTVTDAIDAGGEHLPYRVTLRLEQARQAALARALGSVQSSPVELASLSRLSGASSAATAIRAGGPAGHQDPEAGRWWRFGSIVLPLLIVVSGLIGIAVWHEADDVADLAEVDAGLVLNDDDLPVSAMADRGFGVFLRNTRQ